MDLDSPGITVKPIHTLSDELEFCEVFFDSVRVPKYRLVAELHKGWSMAKALLGHERLFVGSPRYVSGAFDRLTSLAEEEGLFEPGSFLDRYVQLELDYQDFVSLYSDYSKFVKNGGELGAEASILKLLSSETYQAITEEMLSASAEAGVIGGQNEGNQAEAATLFFQSRPSTIAGGTSQIQRGIIAKAVLGLPT
ncbi:MAG: acyl-CoA dehydrogenase family protein [Gemmobacter sp.]|nr:acyl-CoA dehydrogenase family protein [Gemmobacter sp.]